MKGILKSYINDYYNLEKICKKYLFFYMLQSVSAGVGFFIAIFLNINLGFTTDIIGFIVGCFVAGNLFGSWLTTRILDKLNPYHISGLSLIIQGIGFLVICSTSTMWVIAISMFIMGAGGYIYMITNDFLITNLAGKCYEKRSIAISLLNVFSNIGVGIGGVVVSYLSKNHSVVMLCTIGIVLIIISVPHFFESSATKESPVISVTEESLSNFRLYMLSLVAIFTMGIIFAQQRIGYSLFLERSFGEGGASSIFMINSLLIVFFLTSVTKVANKFNQVIIMGLGGLLLGGGMYMLQYANTFPFVVLICLISTLGEMLGTVLSQLICFQSAKKGRRGKAMGNYKFLYAFGTIIGTTLGGKIQENFGDNYIWTLCGVTGLILFLICISFYRPKYQIKFLIN